MGGRQGSNIIFFLQICNEVPGEKKEGGMSPLQRATGPCGPARGAGRPSCGRQGGPVAPPAGDRVRPPLYKASPLISSSFDLKKIHKKERGEEKGSGEALPDCALVICRLVHLDYVFFIGIVE